MRIFNACTEAEEQVRTNLDEQVEVLQYKDHLKYIK